MEKAQEKYTILPEKNYKGQNSLVEMKKKVRAKVYLWVRKDLIGSVNDFDYRFRLSGFYNLKNEVKEQEKIHLAGHYNGVRIVDDKEQETEFKLFKDFRKSKRLPGVIKNCRNIYGKDDSEGGKRFEFTVKDGYKNANVFLEVFKECGRCGFHLILKADRKFRKFSFSRGEDLKLNIEVSPAFRNIRFIQLLFACWNLLMDKEINNESFEWEEIKNMDWLFFIS